MNWIFNGVLPRWFDYQLILSADHNTMVVSGTSLSIHYKVILVPIGSLERLKIQYVNEPPKGRILVSMYQAYVPS